MNITPEVEFTTEQNSSVPFFYLSGLIVKVNKTAWISKLTGHPIGNQGLIFPQIFTSVFKGLIFLPKFCSILLEVFSLIIRVYGRNLKSKELRPKAKEKYEEFFFLEGSFMSFCSYICSYFCYCSLRNT